MIVPRAVRSAAAITGGVLAFASLVEAAGLIPAAAAASFVASTASRGVNLREALILSLAVAAAMAILFVGLLKQSFSLIAGL